MAKYPHHAVLYLVATANHHGMTIREVERKAELGVNTIHRWHKHGRTPDLDKLEKALAIFNLRMGVVQRFP